MVLVAPSVLAAFGVDGDDYTVTQLAAATGAAWLVMVAALAFTSNHYGTHDPLRDFVEHYALRFRPIDLAGIPAGRWRRLSPEEMTRLQALVDDAWT